MNWVEGPWAGIDGESRTLGVVMGLGHGWVNSAQCGLLAQYYVLDIR